MQLDPDTPDEERTRKLKRAATKIEYWQDSRARAAKSHRKAAVRKLQALGLELDQLRTCLWRDVAL